MADSLGPVGLTEVKIHFFNSQFLTLYKVKKAIINSTCQANSELGELAHDMKISQIKNFQTANRQSGIQVTNNKELIKEQNFTPRKALNVFTKKSGTNQKDRRSSVTSNKNPRVANKLDLSLLNKNSGDDSENDDDNNSKESEVNAVDIEKTFNAPAKQQVKLSDINTTNDSNQKMKGSGLGDRLKNKIAQEKGSKKSTKKQERQLRKGNSDDEDGKFAGDEISQDSGSGDGSSTEREMQEEIDEFGDAKDEVEGENPYKKNKITETLKSIDLKEISRIQKNGSQWDGHIENLDESKESIIFGEAIEKSSLDHFNAFDNSVATHQELKKVDNFFQTLDKNTLKRKSFEDIFDVNNEDPSHQNSPISKKEEQELKIPKPQISSFKQSNNGGQEIRFTKRKDSSMASSSKQSSPKTDKNVTEGLRKELFQDEQHPEDDNSKKEPINKNDEHIFDNKAQGKAAAGRRNQGTSVKIKIGAKTETDALEQNDNQVVDSQAKSTTNQDKNGQINIVDIEKKEIKTQVLVAEKANEEYLANMDVFPQQTNKQKHNDHGVFNNSISLEDNNFNPFANFGIRDSQASFEQNYLQDDQNKQGEIDFFSPFKDQERKMNQFTKKLIEENEKNVSQSPKEKDQNLKSADKKVANIDTPMLVNKNNMHTDVKVKDDPFFTITDFEKSPSVFFEQLSQSAQINTPSSNAQFRMDDFESAYSRSEINNEHMHKNEILPQRGASRLGNTDDEDFFSTSSQPQNPLFSPAPELFEGHISHKNLKEKSEEEQEVNQISRVEEVDVQQEESSSIIEHYKPNLMIDTDLESSPFKITELISPITQGTVIIIPELAQDTKSKSGRDQIDLNDLHNTSLQNQTFDPFNQGFGAFGDESQSQSRLQENMDDYFKKDSVVRTNRVSIKKLSVVIENDNVLDEEVDNNKKQTVVGVEVKDKVEDKKETVVVVDVDVDVVDQKKAEVVGEVKKQKERPKKIAFGSIQNFGFDLNEPTPIYKQDDGKEEVFGFGNLSNKDGNSHLGGMSWNAEDNSIVLEELGESKDVSESEQFFDEI